MVATRMDAALLGRTRPSPAPSQRRQAFAGATSRAPVAITPITPTAVVHPLNLQSLDRPAAADSRLSVSVGSTQSPTPTARTGGGRPPRPFSAGTSRGGGESDALLGSQLLPPPPPPPPSLRSKLSWPRRLSRSSLSRPSPRASKQLSGSIAAAAYAADASAAQHAPPPPADADADADREDRLMAAMAKRKWLCCFVPAALRNRDGGVLRRRGKNEAAVQSGT